MKKLIVENFWIKVFSLLLAMIMWLYVVGELNKGTPEEKAIFGRILPYKLEAVEVPVKVTLIGKPIAGYRVLNDRIVIKPSTCLIMGPKSMIKDIPYVTTEDIDLSEFTRSVVRQVRLKQVGPGISLEKDFFITVVVPITKIEQERER
ncbi:MAG: YbbR-like domain-containing protein [Candidatus Omnitrophota bacterium]